MKYLKNFFLQHHPSLGWFIQKICKKNYLQDWLIRCPVVEIRSTFADLLLFLVKSLMSHEKSSLIEDELFQTSDDEMEEVDPESPFSTHTGFLINSMINIMHYAEWSVRYFDQMYRFLFEFGRLGDTALTYLVKNDAISWVIWHLLKEENNGRKLSKGKRSKKEPLVPDSKHALDFIRLLVCSSHTRKRFSQDDDDEDDDSVVAPPPTLLKQSNTIFTLAPENPKDKDSHQPLNKRFLLKIMTCGTNPLATAAILNHWAWQDPPVLKHFFTLICEAYSNTDYDHLEPLFDSLESLLLFECPDSLSRVQTGLDIFLQEVEARKKAPKKTKKAIDFIKSLQQKSQAVIEYTASNWESVGWLWSY